MIGGSFTPESHEWAVRKADTASPLHNEPSHTMPFSSHLHIALRCGVTEEGDPPEPTHLRSSKSLPSSCTVHERVRRPVVVVWAFLLGIGPIRGAHPFSTHRQHGLLAGWHFPSPSVLP